MYGPLSNLALWPLSDALVFNSVTQAHLSQNIELGNLLVTSNLGSTVLVTLWTREAL